MTIPSDRNLVLKEIEKKSKCKDLQLEIQRMWQMKTEVIPVVAGGLGTVKKGLVENIEKLSKIYCAKDPKDLHAGICTNPQEGYQGCLPFDRKIRLGWRKHNGKQFASLP